MRHICLHTASFVYVSGSKVRLGAILSAEIRSSEIFVYITWPPESRTSAIFVYTWRHEVIDPAAMFVYSMWLWRHRVGGCVCYTRTLSTDRNTEPWRRYEELNENEYDQEKGCF